MNYILRFTCFRSRFLSDRLCKKERFVKRELMNLAGVCSVVRFWREDGLVLYKFVFTSF